MNIRIDTAFLGDSLTFGYGVKKEYCWVSKIINYYNLNAVNKGINGDTTPSMLSRIDKDIFSYKPKSIFIMGGSNDLLLERSINSITENIKLMIIDSLKVTSNVIIGIPPYIISSMAYNMFSEYLYYDSVNEKLNVLKNNIIELCFAFNIKYLDFYSITLNKADMYLDGVHLNTEGHNLLFNASIPYFNNK